MADSEVQESVNMEKAYLLHLLRAFNKLMLENHKITEAEYKNVQAQIARMEWEK